MLFYRASPPFSFSSRSRQGKWLLLAERFLRRLLMFSLNIFVLVAFPVSPAMVIWSQRTRGVWVDRNFTPSFFYFCLRLFFLGFGLEGRGGGTMSHSFYLIGYLVAPLFLVFFCCVFQQRKRKSTITFNLINLLFRSSIKMMFFFLISWRPHLRS